MKILFTCYTFIITIMCSFTAAQANIINNGSFETPILATGAYANYTTGSVGIAGWTVFGPSGTNVALINGLYKEGSYNFPAQDGTQWLDLTGSGANSTEGIQQIVSTTAETTYNLSFGVGNVSGSPYGLTSTIGILVNGTLMGSKINSISGSTLNWQQFDFVFTPNTSSTLVGLENLNPSADNVNGLDNVSLNPVGVPKPASIYILGSILIRMSLLKRRKLKHLTSNYVNKH